MSKLLVIVGTIGGAIATALGGWDAGLETLLVFMAVDYISGLAAAIWHKSPKTPNGGLNSDVGLHGIIRKVMMLLAVLVGAQLDRVIGSDFVRDCVVVAFCANECLSIVENAGIMGVPMPKVIIEAIEVLKERSEKK